MLKHFTSQNLRLFHSTAMKQGSSASLQSPRVAGSKIEDMHFNNPAGYSLLWVAKEEKKKKLCSSVNMNGKNISSLLALTVAQPVFSLTQMIGFYPPDRLHGWPQGTSLYSLGHLRGKSEQNKIKIKLKTPQTATKIIPKQLKYHTKSITKKSPISTYKKKKKNKHIKKRKTKTHKTQINKKLP